MSSETARDLVAQMVAAGEWPEPQLFEAILEQGEDAVEPLLEVVRQEVHGWSEEAPLTHAVRLLGILRVPAAAPALLALYPHYDEETAEDLAETLGVLGPEVVEPLLGFARDETLRWFPRSLAVGAAIRAAGDDSELRARIAATLRELLSGYIARAEELDDDDSDMASFLVSDLADLADPEARDLIRSAFQANVVDQFIVNEESVERSYRGRPSEPERDHRDWLVHYERRYQTHLERLRRPPEDDEDLPEWDEERWQSSRFGTDFGASLPTPVEPIRYEKPRPGRNDPCWCGSGKKYKKCHLPSDQAGGS